MESKTYYRSIRKRIEQEKYLNGRRDQKNGQAIEAELIKDTKASQSIIDFETIYVPKLPKHLKKSFFGTFDRRFTFILGASLLFHILFIYILYKNTSFEVTSDDISKLQKHYANLILDEEAIIKSHEDTDERAAKVRLSSQRKPSSKTAIDDGISKEEFIETDEKTKAKRSRRTRTKELGPSSGIASSDAADQTEKRGTIVAKVSNMGVLEYMKSTVLTSNVDDDFLVYTDAINNNFIRTLDGIDAEDLVAAIKLGDSPNGTQKNIGKLKKPRHLERSAGNVEVKDLFGRDTPLEEAQTIPISKIEQYEKIPSSLDALSRRRKRKVQRTASEISEVIRLHNKAIQDCYKQALRKDVHLKGKIVVQFTINPMGRVTSSSVVSSTVNNERMERCIINKIRRWNDFGICEDQVEDISLKQSYVFGY